MTMMRMMMVSRLLLLLMLRRIGEMGITLLLLLLF